MGAGEAAERCEDEQERGVNGDVSGAVAPAVCGELEDDMQRRHRHRTDLVPKERTASTARTGPGCEWRCVKAGGWFAQQRTGSDRARAG